MQTARNPSIGLSMDDLYSASQTIFPPIVRNLLAPGLTLLIGRPKTGKSWLALQIAAAVSTGTPLWDLETTPGFVLYLALEDSTERIISRSFDLNIPKTARLAFITAWESLASDALEILDNLLKQGVHLLIIDTLTQSFGPAGVPSAKRILAILNTLRLMAQRHQAAILIVDHQRPSRIPLSLDQAVIGGATHAAAVDSILHLRAITPTRTILDIRSRDLPPLSLPLRFDSTFPAWHLNPDADPTPINASAPLANLPVDLTPTQSAILDVLKTCGPTRLTTLSVITGQDPGNLSRRLLNLQRRGLIDKHTQGRAAIYALHGAIVTPDPHAERHTPQNEEERLNAVSVIKASIALAAGAATNTFVPGVCAIPIHNDDLDDAFDHELDNDLD